MEVQGAWSSRIKGRLRVLVPLKEAWTFTFRADANPGGLGGFLDVRWNPSRKWDISTRMTAWSTKDWDSRISFYERDVPGSFPIGNYAGKGIGAYLVARYAPTRHVELWVKAGTEGCAYFVRIFIPG